MNHPSISLPKLAEQINRWHSRAIGDALEGEQKIEQGKKQQARALDHAVKAGQALHKAKVEVKRRGDRWLDWVERNLEFTDRQAQRYLRVARKINKLEENTTRASENDVSPCLSIREADKALRESKPIEDPGQLDLSGTVIDMGPSYVIHLWGDLGRIAQFAKEHQAGDIANGVPEQLMNSFCERTEQVSYWLETLQQELKNGTAQSQLKRNTESKS